MTDAHAETERTLRAACEAGNYPRAATLALDAYGPQILGFLVAQLRSEPEAEEAFSLFAEDLWRGLPSFAFRCSVRSWLYALARHAGARHARGPQRKALRNLALSHEAVLGELVQHLRSTTHMYQRTAVKDEFRALRERLPHDDQALLILHVDKALAWREIAIVMNDGAEMPDDAVLGREAARLRKRFERVKAELKLLAIEAGLLER